VYRIEVSKWSYIIPSALNSIRTGPMSLNEATKKFTISAVLITLNEERNLAECLDSLSFCDEIIIVDGGSTDKTVAIASRYTSKLYVEENWRGFGQQKQRALELASCEWILSIDADERVTKSLQVEILSQLESGVHDGYRLNRVTFFLGRPLLRGGWHPDFVLRLARRRGAAFDLAVVHEALLTDGKVGLLNGVLEHYSYCNVSDILTKMRRYALASSQKKRELGLHGGISLAIARSIWTFLMLYIIRGGLLEGKIGLVASIAKSQEVFWKYVAVDFPDPM
jgi:glycosyltransferase involved in cell wall biosynthesis